MMFKSKNKRKYSDNRVESLISEHCVIEGEVRGSSFIRIDGNITGNVKVEEGVILGESGIINGNVDTPEFVVYGKVNGNIRGRQLELKQTGRVTGEINVQKLIVEPGAVYNGSLHMSEEVPEELNGRKP